VLRAEGRNPRLASTAHAGRVSGIDGNDGRDGAIPHTMRMGRWCFREIEPQQTAPPLPKRERCMTAGSPLGPAWDRRQARVKHSERQPACEGRRCNANALKAASKGAQARGGESRASRLEGCRHWWWDLDGMPSLMDGAKDTGKDLDSSVGTVVRDGKGRKDGSQLPAQSRWATFASIL